MQLKSFIFTALSLSTASAWLGSIDNTDDHLLPRREAIEQCIEARADNLEARDLVFQIHMRRDGSVKGERREADKGVYWWIHS